MARAPRVPRVSVPYAGPIVGIDVETACPENGAICSIGISIICRGAVVRERQWFLDPGTRFDPRFIEIHHITPAQVRGIPKLIAAWSEIHDFMRRTIDEMREPTLFALMPADEPEPLYVAHNASFDRLQIERALGTPLPFRVACTVAMSRRAYPTLLRHNLATVSAHLRIPLKHHDALSDARACAVIAHHCIAAGAGS